MRPQVSKYRSLKIKLLEQQQNCCYYCFQEIGKVCCFRNKVIVLKATIDHVLPYSFKQNNHSSNVVVACHICNQYKAAKVFDSIGDIVIYLQKIWLDEDKKYKPVKRRRKSQCKQNNVKNVKVTLKQQEDGKHSVQPSVAMLGTESNTPLLLAPIVIKPLSVIKPRSYGLKRKRRLSINDRIAMGMYKEVPARIIEINSQYYHIKKE